MLPSKITIKLVFILVLFCFQTYANHLYRVEKGILNLNKIEDVTCPVFELNGEWEFYWMQLLTPSDFKAKKNDTLIYVDVPAAWTNYSINDNKLPAYGYATYRLQLLVNKPYLHMAFKLGDIGTAFNLFIDGDFKYKAGIVGKSKKQAKPAYKPGVVEFKPTKDTVEIIIQVSNFHYSKGGIWNNYNKIGVNSKIQDSRNTDMQLSILLIGIMLIIAFYHLALFFINSNFCYTLYFSLFCLIILGRTLVINEIYLLEIFPNFNWALQIKIEYLSLLLGALTFTIFIYKFFNEYYSKKIYIGFVTSSSVLSLFVIATPVALFTRFLLLYQILVILASAYIIYVVISALKTRKQATTVFLVGFVLMFLCILNDILYVYKIIDSIYLTTYGLIIFIFSQAVMLAIRFSLLFTRSEVLTKKLETTNLNLESIVEKRTAKIKEQNSVLRDQRNHLAEQNKKVEVQKQQITSSIGYASKIQGAVLSTENCIDCIAPNNFILFKPKDIVSGDFYWFKELHLGDKKYKIVSVVDCTGHGVPGAFMSILGAMLLNNVINEFKNELIASEILNQLRYQVKKLLHQNTSEITVKDGMDLSLIIFEEKGSIQFAGAQLPIYIIRSGENKKGEHFEEFKGDKMPIGIYVKEKDTFTNHIIELHKDDMVYLFTDGFYDQFGGEFGKKYGKSTFKNKLKEIAHLSTGEQKEILENEFVSWKRNKDQIDDITVIGIRI